MAQKDVQRSEWEEFLGRLSKKVKEGSEKVLIHIAVPSVKEFDEAEQLEFLGIEYDKKNEIITIFCRDLDHNIKAPEQVILEEDDQGITEIIIKDAAGQEHQIRFLVPIQV